MQPKRGELIPIGEVVSGLDDVPVPVIHGTSPQARHHFTVAVLVYRALAPKKVTIIEILPDYPAGGEPKNTNKDQSSNMTASGEAVAASLIEESSAERLRRQSRRAVMRQDLPLDLSSRPVHAHSSGND